VRSAVARLGVRLPRPTAPWYGEPPAAERREFLARAAAAGIDRLPAAPDGEPLSSRLWRRYGRGALAIVDEIGRDASLAREVVEGAELCRAEVLFAAREELVVRLDDLLRRRTRIALARRRDELRGAAGLREACELLAGDRGGELFDEYFGA
jgi:glycerol-3-phosphate dehydrogenase